MVPAPGLERANDEYSAPNGRCKPRKMDVGGKISFYPACIYGIIFYPTGTGALTQRRHNMSVFEKFGKRDEPSANGDLLQKYVGYGEDGAPLAERLDHMAQAHRRDRETGGRAAARLERRVGTLVDHRHRRRRSNDG